MNDLLYRHNKYLKYLLVLSFITFVILFAATSAQGACLSIDAQTTGTTATNTDSSMTVSHTTGSDSDRLMLVGINVNVNDNETVTGVTYGGTALTKVGEQANGNDAMVYIYSLVAPDPGTADVVINFSSALNYGAIAGVMTFTGVDQTTPLGAFASAIGDDTTQASVDIASAPGELVFGVVTCEYDPINAAVTGQDVQWNTTTANGNYGAGGTDAGASPSVTMTWGFEVASPVYNHWAIGGVSIKPAGTKNLVMVTGDGTTTTDVDDTGKRALFESWGWTVTSIAAAAAQGTYDTAAANNDVMYISESCSSSSVSTKATLLDIGIVNEENYTWDQMRFTTTADQDLLHTTINISNNSHYITSVFSTGNMMIFSSQDGIGNMVAGLASGGQLLATENNSGSPTLFYFETGAALTSGTAPNRRVGIPTSYSTFTNWNADVKTIVQRSLDWASGCGGGVISSCGTNLVMVVGTDTSQPYDAAKQTLFESWGWTVSTINDFDSQTVYDTAAANNDVMYISESVSSGNVNTKARDLNIGIVDDECWLWDEMEYGSTGNGGADWGTTINLTTESQSHYITENFSTGSLTIYSTGANINNLPSSLASGGQLLAQTPSGGDPTLFTFDTGATLDSGTAANRRVGFPSFDSNPSNWTTDLETLLQRSLEWAAGCGAGGSGSTNNYPVLDLIGNKSVDEGQLLEFTISATDPDTGDTLTYSASNLPTGATFDPATQTFSWTPGVGDAGTYTNVTFRVDDDGTPPYFDDEGITITVNSSGGGSLGTPITAGDVAGYSCNMRITIDHTKVAFASENFPVLISLTDDSLTTSGCGFVTDPDGDDIVFTNSTVTLQLHHEIEKYDAATGELVAWVLVPSLSGSADTDIYMYFGDSNVTSPTENPTGVWDSNYVGVWHLDDTSGDTQDSTSYNTDGVVTGTVTRSATGKMDNAFDFYTNGEVDWGDPADEHLNFGTGEMTLSLWVNMDSHRGVWEQIILKGKSSYQSGYQIEVDSSSNTFYFSINEQSGEYEWGRTAAIPFSLDTWTYIVGVVDRTNNLVRGYKDGVQVDTSGISLIGSIDVADNLTIGRNTWGWPDARIEEVRLSKTARSAEWIQTSYNNQNSPSSFYSVVNNCPSTVPPIAEFSCSIPLTIDSSKVSGTSDLTDFPVLISLTNTSLKTTGNCGYVQNSNGYDIIFSDATQTTRLDHEIEKYDSAAGELVAWVRVPTLSATSDTTIYMHFGHSSVCGATENPTGVWNSNYTTVWHLRETSGGAGAIKDSTAGANHGTDFNSPTFGATGKIGNAIDFDGANDYATMPTSGFSTSAGTVELWANIDTFPPTDKKYMFSHFTPSPIANRVYVDLKPDNTWGTGMGDTYDL
ncbi:MAG: DUF2341 domain-containing protein, partial [Syntrophobacterales bacterium]